MNITLLDIDIAYARICGRPPPLKFGDLPNPEIEKALLDHSALDANDNLSELRKTNE